MSRKLFLTTGKRGRKIPAKTKKDKQQDRDIARLKRMFSPEKKWLNTQLTAVDLNTSWSFAILNGLVQGTDVNDRVGDKVRFIKLEISGIAQTAAVVGGSAVVRFCVVQDKQPNGTTFTTSELMEDQNDIWSLYNNVFSSRFNVLYDKIIDLNVLAANASAITYRSFRKTKKLNIVTHYSSAVGTIVDIETNSLYFIYASNIASGSDDPVAHAHVRLTYTDN